MDVPLETAPLPKRCALHSAADAVAVCERCGAFACESCRRDVEGSALCASCQDRRLNRPPSAAAVLSLVLAALTPLGLLPGIAGGVIGARELKRIQAGQSPVTGEGYARLARALGAFSAAALVAIVLWAVARSLE